MNAGGSFRTCEGHSNSELHTFVEIVFCHYIIFKSIFTLLSNVYHY